MDICKIDSELIWHPFTQHQIAKAPIAISSGKGSYLFDINGKKYLDLVSSWWVNLHGHAHPEIAKAISLQANQLEHVIFANFTHQPAVLYADMLRSILPKNLNKFFYSDNGSTAVEIALKMSYQYWVNQNHHERKLFICFDGGYHGDTFGAMSVGKASGFHDKFKQLFFQVLQLPYPSTWIDDPDINQKEEQSLAALDNLLSEYGEKIAAIILEPLMQGASGMRFARPDFIEKIILKVRQYDILVIFDEVMTGYGRTGTNFALDQIRIQPDFLCLSKGITGGFLPLALTISTSHIFNQFLSSNYDLSFAHGHSYTANPIACSAAIASFKILTEEKTGLAIKAINQAHCDGIKILQNNNPKISKFRILGTIAAFDLNENIINLNQIKDAFINHGLLIRPLGNVVYLMPPYCTSYDELIDVYKKIANIINTSCKT